MKQIVLLAIVAFVCAVGGATWFSAWLMPPKPRVAASAPGPITPGTAVPTTLPPKKPKPADTGKKAAARPATGARKPAPVAPGTDSAAKAKTAVDTSLAKHPVLTVDSAALVRGAKSVAKVVASMKPKDAVGILGHLSDDEVERIVRQLNPKQVAALLAAFPQERAAGLSRKLLGPKT
jgi:hypothetical protein